MYFLDYVGICADPKMTPIWNIVGFIVKAIWIGVPILLIIFGMIDLGKAVIASKEDEVKKAWKAFGRRFLVAVAVFAVVWAVGAVFSLVSKVGDGAIDGYNEESWNACWCRITNGSNTDGTCKK